MAHRDLRDFLAVAEQRGLLRRIKKPVDHTWEPACFAKWMYQAMPDEDRFGLYFENVEGSDISVATAVLGASTETYALALGVEPEDINETWMQAMISPIPPCVVESAPCHEIIWTGDDARLNRLPVPVWTPGKDAAPYFTVPVLTQNADTGAQNMGFYRTMIREDGAVVINLSPGRQGTMDCETWLSRGKPAPLAWIIGAEPVVQLASTLNLPKGQEELAVAGAVKGEAIELVKARMSDLLVPANTEIVVEGEVVPGEIGMEGPFGEFAGFMGPVMPKPVGRITAITMRKNPIFYGVTSQMPPSESTVIQSLTNAGVILKMLRHDLSELSVSDVYIDLTFGGLLAHAVVAMEPRYTGHAKKVGRMVADCTPVKRVTVVDPDIDIRDSSHIEWAMNARYHPARDTVIIDDVFAPMGMDPAVRVVDTDTDQGSKVVIDATATIDSGEFSLPGKEVMARALESWRDAGLPEFDIPKRAKLRLDKS